MKEEKTKNNPQTKNLGSIKTAAMAKSQAGAILLITAY